jgi:hypothetical protein
MEFVIFKLSNKILVKIQVYLYLFKKYLGLGYNSFIVIFPSWFCVYLYPSIRINILLVLISGSIKRFIV